MHSGEVRKVSLQDIQSVKNLVEWCLQLYMSKREVVNTLFHQAKIEPIFTELVWQKLESENPEFFMAYKTRLILKDQILRFNQLLERQVELIHHMIQNGVSSTLIPNGSLIHPMGRNSFHRDPQPHMHIKSENVMPVEMIPHDYTNGTYSPQQHMEVAAPMLVHAGSMDFPAYMASHHNPNAGIMQGFDERIIKTEGFYAGNFPAMFHADNNFLEAQYRDFSIPPVNGGESCSQSFSESFLDAEMNSFGAEQMTPNFSLSDQTPNFPRSTDILESYSGSSFMATNTNYLHPQPDKSIGG